MQYKKSCKSLRCWGFGGPNFLKQPVFYGGTSLRILHGLNRFSEDLDFSLLEPNPSFDLVPFLNAIEEELEISGLKISIEHKIKHPEESIRSAFLKTGTLETFIRIGLDGPLKRHTQSNEVIKIKLEVDIDPPPGFKTEIRYLEGGFHSPYGLILRMIDSRVKCMRFYAVLTKFG